MARAPLRPLQLAAPDVETRRSADGGIVLRSRLELGPYPPRLGDWLRQWAQAAPERDFLAERTVGGDWRRVTYRQALEAVERIAAALLARGLNRERPVLILSDNGIDNQLLQQAAMYVGIPAVPISPAYSLVSRDRVQLRHSLELIRPGLIYAADGARYAEALGAVGVGEECELVVSASPPHGRRATDFASLLAAAPSAEVARRFAEVGPETVAKILLTSGSTGRPKGVINPQRMLCSNQQGMAQLWPFVEERPPVIVDWLPWNHTFGGNHNVHLVLRNGGTLYIDGGKPAPGLIETTIRNLREIPSTIHFNVPRGYDMLVPHLERDRVLRETFFRDLEMMFYAGASLPQHLWERLERLSIETTGHRVVMLSAWGSTETGPSATMLHWPIERAGSIGLPLPGIEIKLAPIGGKHELRVRGPNIAPGYWRRPDLTAEMFDEDGFFRMGDAGRLADPGDAAKGLVFDGRLAENFKLSSGAWVQVGALRPEIVSAGAPVIQDAVLTGHDRGEIGLLVFPNLAGCRSLCPDAGGEATLVELIRRPEVRDRLAGGLDAYNRANPASSRRIACALLMAEPPAIDAGEITDKGYINQRAVLEHRAALVARLHDGTGDPEVIRLAPPALAREA